MPASRRRGPLSTPKSRHALPPPWPLLVVAVIHPSNRLVTVFDFVVAACVLYSAIVAPMKVAYRSNWLDELEYLFDVVFLMGERA